MPVPLAFDPIAFLGPLAVAGAVIGAFYLVTARSRARARRLHGDVATTGRGTWIGMLDVDDVERFFPDVPIGAFRSTFLFDGGVPVRIELDPDGVRLGITSRYLKSAANQVWSAPWSDVVSAEGRSVGFRSLGGKLSVVRLTDVRVVVAGQSAERFLDSWDLIPDPDDPSTTPEDIEEEAAWMEFVSDELGPGWQPGTAVLRVRTSAPEGLVDAVARWARG